jgi:hypothetical protein
MWTTKQNNRVALVFVTLGTVGFAAIAAIPLAAERRWGWALAIGAAAAAVAGTTARRYWRNSSFGVFSQGKATDEREAYIMLRSWATVGQVGMAASLALVVVDAFGKPQLGTGFWLLVLFSLTQLVTVAWLKARS